MTRRPRVLITGPAPPPPGGIASVIDTILESELRERYELLRFGTTEMRFEARSAPVRALNSALSRTFGFDGVVNLESRAKLRAYRRALEARPDLVHVHTSHGYDFWLGVWIARIARRRGIPALLHLHGLFDVVVPSWSAVRRAAFQRALRVPDRVLVLSEGWRRWFESRVPAERLVVLRNPVDVRRFRPRDRGAPDDAVRLLFVGASDPRRKGAYDILEAAPAIVRQAPHVRFVIVGEDVDQLQARHVRGTPLEPFVDFAGSRDAAGIAPFFEQADVLLLPSYSEGLPIALLEGMAAGLPVVACPVNGIPEAMSDPENGVFVSPGDPAALARAVLELVRDPERRRRIGAANRRRAEREFDRSHYAERLGAVYESLLP